MEATNPRDYYTTKCIFLKPLILMKSCHPFKSHATQYLCSTCNSGVCSDPPLPFEAWIKCTMYID